MIAAIAQIIGSRLLSNPQKKSSFFQYLNKEKFEIKPSNWFNLSS
jgi:hypothetical protein